ncbi:MAG: DEAD/DEAH box helicase [Thermoplasmatota archaeon]
MQVAPSAEPSFVSHPLIRDDAIARRDYQLAVAVEATKRNTLVILPTGMGKTVVALLVMASRVTRAKGKVLFLAPTKPLVEQHAAFVRDFGKFGAVETFTGETPPEDRELAWREASVVCSTPQVIENDLIAGRISLREVTLVVFDEAHRAVGNYAYVLIAERYREERPDGLVLGMTASPGSNAQKIRDVTSALGIQGVEVRTESDADTAQYMQDVAVEWKPVLVPDNLKHIASALRSILMDRVNELRGAQVYAMPYVSTKELLAAGARLQAKLRDGTADGGVYSALSSQAAALKVNHALELVETQGTGALASYLDRLAVDESKAAKALVADARMQAVLKGLDAKGAEHPKLRAVMVLLRQQIAAKPDARVIVFTTYRDTADLLVRELSKEGSIRPAKFVGQAARSESDRGLSQKQQIELVQRFKAGDVNTLVATSVAEEGLDIPQVDLVVFFEPVPSEIRSIQRRGRTGRTRAGRVVVLMAKGTQDEAYHWASRGKEKKMRKEIDALKQYFAAVNASEGSEEWKRVFAPGAASAPPSGGSSVSRVGERTLDAFVDAATDAAPREAKPVIVVDTREFASTVAREIARLGLVVRPETLAAGDYVLSDRVAVERKEATDYASSLLDGRLFEQARKLRDAYSAPILVVEGDGLFTARRIEPAAIYASFAALIADFGVSVFQTRDAKETAALLASIARREQTGEKREVALRGAKSAMNDEERLRYVVEGLPGVSAVLARRLLERFGTLRAIANAKLEELMEVEGVGEKTAGEIVRVLTAVYGRKR